MQITDEMVERGARAMCEMDLRCRLTDAEWKRIRDSGLRMTWLQLARKCIAAALGGEASEDVQQNRA